MKTGIIINGIELTATEVILNSKSENKSLKTIVKTENHINGLKASTQIKYNLGVISRMEKLIQIETLENSLYTVRTVSEYEKIDRKLTKLRGY